MNTRALQTAMVLVNASWRVSGHICSTSIASAEFDLDKCLANSMYMELEVQ